MTIIAIALFAVTLGLFIKHIFQYRLETEQYKERLSDLLLLLEQQQSELRAMYDDMQSHVEIAQYAALKARDVGLLPLCLGDDKKAVLWLGEQIDDPEYGYIGDYKVYVLNAWEKKLECLSPRYTLWLDEAAGEALLSDRQDNSAWVRYVLGTYGSVITMHGETRTAVSIGLPVSAPIQLDLFPNEVVS